MKTISIKVKNLLENLLENIEKLSDLDLQKVELQKEEYDQLMSLLLCLLESKVEK